MDLYVVSGPDRRLQTSPTTVAENPSKVDGTGAASVFRVKGAGRQIIKSDSITVKIAVIAGLVRRNFARYLIILTLVTPVFPS
jgi:hypothetical protein